MCGETGETKTKKKTIKNPSYEKIFLKQKEKKKREKPTKVKGVHYPHSIQSLHSTIRIFFSISKEFSNVERKKTK